MLVVISPAKNLDYETPVPTKKQSDVALIDQSEMLAKQLKLMSPQDISGLMGISDKLGVLNYDRFQAWQAPMPVSESRQAVLAFKGDVYVGLDAYNWQAQDFDFAQKHLRILSGLYGLLRPLDSVMPYRLEMGTKLENERGKDLYTFWGEQITQALNAQLAATKSDVLVNLASNEYFKSVKKAKLNAKIITPVFKDWKNDKYKIISFYAKKARGLMSAYIIHNKLQSVEQIKGFDVGGYSFNDAMSSETEWVFTRQQA